MGMKLSGKMGMGTKSDYGNGVGREWEKSWEWEGIGIKMVIPHTSTTQSVSSLGIFRANSLTPALTTARYAVLPTSVPRRRRCAIA